MENLTIDQVKEPEVIKLPSFKEYPKRIIKVKRFLPNFLMAAHKEVFGDATTPLAACVDATTQKTLRPLSREEEFILMPEVLNIRMDAPEFNAALEDWFASFNIDIPEEDLTLDITIQEEKIARKSNGEEIRIEYPVNINDYIVYRFIEKCIKKNFKVAASIKDAVVGIHDFYIEDVQKDDEIKNKNYKEVQKVRFDFIALTVGENSEKNKNKIELLFDVTYKYHNKLSAKTSLEDMIRILDEKVLSEKPEIIEKFLKDDKLEDKALINKLTIYNIITKEGDIYFDDATAMGKLSDAIIYLNNPIRSGIKEKLRAKLEQKIKMS